MNPDIHAISCDFARRLHLFLGDPEKLLEIDRINSQSNNPAICHSHQLCDPNSFLLSAVNAASGKSEDYFYATDAAHVALCDRVFAYTRKTGFHHLAMLPTPTPQHRRR